MANDAYYYMRVTAHDPDVLERLYKIMKYEDPEYYIYRVFEVRMGEPFKDGGLYQADYTGDVAWGINRWFENKEDPKGIDEKTGAHYISLDRLSGKLGFAAEVYCEECDCCFGQHYACAYGKTLLGEDCHYFSSYAENEEDLKIMKKHYMMANGKEMPHNEFEKCRTYVEKGCSVNYGTGGFEWDFTDPGDATKGRFKKGTIKEFELKGCMIG